MWGLAFQGGDDGLKTASHRPFEILWRLLQQGGQPPDEFEDMLFMLIYLAALLALFWLMSKVAHVPLRKKTERSSIPRQLPRPNVSLFATGRTRVGDGGFGSPGDLVRSALRGGAHPLSHQITNLSVSPKRQFRSETRPVAEWVWIKL